VPKRRGRAPHPGWGQLELAPNQGRHIEILQEALALAEEDAREAGTVGYAAWLFTQLALPYRDPGPIPYWERHNGGLTLRVSPGAVTDPRTGETVEDLAYPFGVMPRLLFTWMATEAQETMNPVLSLGHSLNEFLCRLGLVNGGGPKGPGLRLRHQMERLFSCTMTVRAVQAVGPGISRLRGQPFNVADEYDLWLDHRRPDDQPLWQSTVTLTPRFYEEIVSSPIPVDLRALRALRGSPLRLDIYTWLTHRMHALTKTGRQATVSWKALALQFGGNYDELRMFKRQFLRQLAAVRLVYPLADVQPIEAGLVLRPSPPHVPPGRRSVRHG